tara:strand:+ start:1408 stop:1995 length:588 start_codon:yes stop_codon:yes gene_type:complete
MKLDKLTESLLSGASKNWVGTPFEKYPMLSSKAKGKLGEHYVEGYMRSRFDSNVCPPTESDHDRIIDGYNTEIKFGLASSPKTAKYKIKLNSFTFNHIGCKKDWDRLIFCGINPQKKNTNIYKPEGHDWQEINMYFMEKKDFLAYMKKKNSKSNIFAHQQGGKKGKNDDYMVANPKKFGKLISLPFVKPISQWGK